MEGEGRRRVIARSLGCITVAILIGLVSLCWCTVVAGLFSKGEEQGWDPRRHFACFI